LGYGTINETIQELAGDDLEGTVSGNFYDLGIDSEINKEFVAAIEEMSGVRPSHIEVQGYDAVKAICAAMTLADSTTDYGAIADAMHEIEVDSPRGLLKFGEDNKPSSATFYIQSVVDGKIEIIDTAN
jgi:ABC-type branched-subunit amino acid transport system substrate-binding protein